MELQIGVAAATRMQMEVVPKDLGKVLLCFACSHDANGILLGSIKVMLFVTLQCRN